MNMVRVLIQIPRPLKAKLDLARKRGITAAGLIRHLLEQHFKGKKAATHPAALNLPLLHLQPRLKERFANEQHEDGSYIILSEIASPIHP